MAGQNFYLITSLPPVGELGSVPPLGLSQLLEHVASSTAAKALVEVLLLSDDLLQHQAYLAGELAEPQPVVLTAAQARDEEPLPEYLAPAEEQAPQPAATDALWAAYFRHASRAARQHRSGFLAAWCGYEVALRNALAAERAKALELEAEAYLVAAELAQDDLNFDALVSEWGAAPDPLAALRTLDMARWNWLDENDAWFSFANDELTAYATRLMLLHRWHRLSEAAEGNSTRQQRQTHQLERGTAK